MKTILIVKNKKVRVYKKKREKGITLIALVITIVVLLILAGVSIAMLTGDNGILTQAKKAQTETQIAEIKEKAQTDILGEQAENQTADISRIELKEILDKYFDNVPEDYTLDTEITAKDEYGNYKMKVSDIYNGKIIEKGITSEDIAKAKDKSEYYGAIVKGYELPSTTKTDVNWKIFYADENNIYLIADNYVEITNLPNSTTADGKATSNRPNDGYISYPRAAYFTNILGDYAGSSRITDSKLKALNNDYFTKNYSSTNENMKAVAYMMDTTAWNSKFKDVNNKAEYVIGGPTIEMLMKSYSQKHGVDYQARAKDTVGYEISTDGGKTWKNYMPDSSEYLDTEDSLYVINSNSNANFMWLSSPSANDTDNIMSVHYNGTVSNRRYGDAGGGFRPLVCLKSDIQLQKNVDGTYTIK